MDMDTKDPEPEEPQLKETKENESHSSSSFEFPTENTLSREQLDRLIAPENEEKLKPFLENPLIRKLILQLDDSNSESIWKDYEAAMKDSEFSKFAKLILKFVDKDQNHYSNVEMDESDDE